MKKVFPAAGLLVLFMGALLQAAPLNLAGNSTVSVENVFYSSAKDSNQQLIDGVKVPVSVVMMGRQAGWDFNLVSNFYVNQWNENKIKVDLLTLQTKSKIGGNDLSLVLGDTYFRKSPYTIMNRKIRGLSGNAALLTGPNNADLLSLNFVLGQSKEAQEESSHIANTTYRRIATTGTYRQYLGTGVLRFKPLADLNADVTVLHAFDDKNSIKAQTTGIRNTLFGTRVDYSFWKQQILCGVLFDRSSYDENILDHTGAVDDNVVQASLEGRIKEFKFNGGFDYVGPYYFTAGYPYLENNRRGFNAEIGYTVKGLLQGDISFEDYVTNLDNDTTMHATRTDLVNVNLLTAWDKNPNFNVGYTLKNEKSPQLADRTLVDRQSHTVSTGLDVNWPLVRGSFTVSDKIIKDNSQLYIAAGSTVDSTIFENTNQLSFSTSLRYRPTSTVTLMGGANNIISSSTARDNKEQKLLINYFYLSMVSYVAQRKYSPTIDLTYSNNIDRVDDGNTKHFLKAKTGLEYKLNKAQSAKLYYSFENSLKKDPAQNYKMVSDYTANTVGAEYTLLF